MSEEEILGQESVDEQTAEPVESEDSGTSEPDETAWPESGGGESEESQPQSEKKPGKGYQKRIDELVREREDWKRAALSSIPQSPVQPPPQPQQPVTYPDLAKPKSDDFDTYDDYVEALTDYRHEVKFRQTQAQQQIETIERAKLSFHDKAAAKYSDWQEKFAPTPISDFTRDVLLSIDGGVDVAYFLANNQTEARRIYNLPPAQQAYELGRLESKLASAPPKQRTTTGSPKPTSPVGGKETPSRKPEDMEYEDYKRWRASGGGK